MGWFNHQLAMCCDIFFTQELETWKLLETIAAQLGFLVLRNQFFALATKKKHPPPKKYFAGPASRPGTNGVKITRVSRAVLDPSYPYL